MRMRIIVEDEVGLLFAFGIGRTLEGRRLFFVEEVYIAEVDAGGAKEFSICYKTKYLGYNALLPPILVDCVPCVASTLLTVRGPEIDDNMSRAVAVWMPRYMSCAT